MFRSGACTWLRGGKQNAEETCHAERGLYIAGGNRVRHGQDGLGQPDRPRLRSLPDPARHIRGSQRVRPIGIIDLEGNPFGPGNTDTIVERIQGIDPFPFPGGLETIDIELVSLSLVSTAPVDLTPLGGPFVGVFADLHTTINKGGIIPGLPQPDLLPPSIGQMTIRHENAGGGTFDSFFDVFANAIFTIVGGDPGNPLDVFFSQVAPQVSLSSTNSTWSHTAPLGDVHNAMFPAGEFYVTGIDHVGPHPVTPATPAPGSLALLALGGLFARRRRR